MLAFVMARNGLKLDFSRARRSTRARALAQPYLELHLSPPLHGGGKNVWAYAYAWKNASFENVLTALLTQKRNEQAREGEPISNLPREIHFILHSVHQQPT